jgi:hypothetical protein
LSALNDIHHQTPDHDHSDLPATAAFGWDSLQNNFPISRVR